MEVTHGFNTNALADQLIFIEKSLPIGWRISQVAGGALIAYGVLVMFVPTVLPTMM